LQDLLAAEAHILAPDRPRDVDEIVNYVAAMTYGLAGLQDLPFRYVSSAKSMKGCCGACAAHD
jgi:hypothetical protein